MSFALTAIQHRNTRIQSKGLLFQFILSEFITSYSEALTMHQLLPSVEHMVNSETISALKANLIKLAGSTGNYSRLFSWNQEDGLLSRLKSFCADFSLQGKKDDHIISKMQSYINQAFLSCIQGLDTIRLLEDSDGPEQNIKKLYKILSKFIKEMRCFSKLTVEIMRQFSGDENVVFFMLRHQPELDRLYGSRFVFKLISKMFPKGITQVSDFLLSQYKQRGFDHLIPTIQKKISELEEIR